MNIKNLMLVLLLMLTACSSTNGTSPSVPTNQAAAQTQALTNPPATEPAAATLTVETLQQASFTNGTAAVTNPSLYTCQGGRKTALGEIKSEDGLSWIVPSNVNTKLPNAADLSNPCAKVAFKSTAEVNLDKIPIIEVDPGGVVITGYIFADNYFELYVNGKPVAKDAVPFTPFNSHIVRFKASYPMTYAMKAVDWEENLGLGTEDNKGNKYYPGDAGIVAVFSDGTVTNESWKAQNFYIAPLMSKSDLIVAEVGGKFIRSTPKASLTPTCTTDCYAAHFIIPDNWYAIDFNDAKWPNATTYTTGTVGVDNKTEYTNFKSEFSKGKFIWTNNLVLDNEIILRHRVEKAPK